MLAVGGLALATPAAVWASTGGAGFGSSPAPTSGSSSSGGKTGTSPATVRRGNVTVRASGNGITVATKASALLRRPLRFSGSAGSAAAGDTVEIERRGRETGYMWAPTTHGIARSDGSFTATWPVNHIGQFSIRAVDERGRTAEVAATSPTLTVTVYRPSIATIYGPGMWGNNTACGKVLRRSTLGLANRTLPCGTPVAVYWHGRTLVVPVIDRGPYANGADWDLTMATAKALGMPGTETVGAVSLPRAG
jgi:peptidoglycan lytic transglycosylase